MEAEITYVMGERLHGPGITLDDARLAVSAAAASMEIVDCRVADWRVELADTVADLASNGAMVIPDEVVPADSFDSRLVGMVLSRNGQVIGTAAGAAALGDPLQVIAWLANVLGERGLALEPGHLV